MSTTERIVTFGEAMIRLSPPHYERLEQARTLDLHVGGSELNVAVTAQRLGAETRYVTRLTSSPLGRLIANRAREHGVDVSQIQWCEEGRIGVYYVEFGASPRPNAVVYDRAGSAFSLIVPKSIDWQKAFEGATLFHTSGIAPAVSKSTAEATREAIDRASAMGLKVSFDLNYRARLWSQTEARKVLGELVERSHILITTEEDTERVFGITGKDYEEVARTLAKRFGLEAVAITLRETPSVWRNTWGAIVYADGEIHRSPIVELELVDRVGAGDSFAGGFLFGCLKGGPAMGVRYGVAVSALKQTNPGDLCWATLDEVERTLNDGSLRIVR